MLSYQALRLYLVKTTPSKDLIEHKEELFDLIKEFRETDGYDQRNDWHIYDVFNHILKVVDNVDNVFVLRLAALFHDVGKPFVAKLGDDGQKHYYGHWDKSLRIFNKYAVNFNMPHEEIELVGNLIKYHDLDLISNPSMVEEVKDKLGENLDLLFLLKKADIASFNPTKQDESLKRLSEMEKLCNSVKYVNH